MLIETWCFLKYPSSFQNKQTQMPNLYIDIYFGEDDEWKGTITEDRDTGNVEVFRSSSPNYVDVVEDIANYLLGKVK
jgi:hypothetical protein